MSSFVPRFSLNSKANVYALMLAAAAYAALSLIVQILLPQYFGTELSPIEGAMWVAIIAGMVATSFRIAECHRGSRMLRYWLLAGGAILAIAILQSEDWTVDTFFSAIDTKATRHLEYLGNATLAIILAAGVVILARLPRDHVWLRRGLLATVAFQVIAILAEAIEHHFRHSLPQAHDYAFALQLAQLLCIEFFVVAVAVSGRARASSRPVFGETEVGARARYDFDHYGLLSRYSHPPVKIAYYPLLQGMAVALVSAWLLVKAGPRVKSFSGVGYFRQLVEMLGLWYSHGIDPPSYFQLEFYKPERRSHADEYLTRFETKNGLFGALNKMRPQPFGTTELGHKKVFDDLCTEHNIPHPRLLMTVENGSATLLAPPESLQTSLFCKMEKGMGAIGTQMFRYNAPDHYIDESGKSHDLSGMIEEITKESEGKLMIVQPWLRNHPDIADLAKDSLITFRVVTCLNAHGEPEITMAMLRVLAKLEPDWTDALDEEYAAPMDLETGQLGLFTGDNMATSPLRYEIQPLTGAQVAGRIVKGWPELRDVALRAHRAVRHRAAVGWDIALTPEGPMVLEGNNNFDVMFLQRVHDVGIGQTRLGVLLAHQLDLLIAGRKDVWAV